MYILFQTIVALIFIYLVSSIVNSLLVESIAQWFNLRGDFLRHHIKNFFTVEKIDRFNPFGRLVYWFKTKVFRVKQNRQINEFGDLIYDHFLIRKFSRKRREYPSYIDAKLFSSVVYDLLLNKIPIKEINKVAIEKEFENLKFTDSEGDALPIKINREVREVIKNIILKASELERNLEDVLQEIEEVYTIYMERVSQWYKNHLKWILFFMGFIIASSSNLDTINLFNIIKKDPQIRSDFFIAAKELDELESVELDDMQKEILIDTLIKKFVVKKDSALLIYPPQVSGETIGQVYKILVDTEEEVPSSFSNLELGPKYLKKFFINKVPFYDEVNNNPIIQFLLKFLGLFITAVALSYGATFWFDLLKKLIRFG